jgi:metallo-beta-lactamase family protein
MFQGGREWREKNWHPPAFDMSSVQSVLLTHAHVDHTGMLPRFFKLGLKVPVFCSGGTADLARLILLDSARLQEEETLFRLETGKSRHHPPLPLYTEADAQGVLSMLKTVPLLTQVEVAPGFKASWSLMGHILSACAITLEVGGKRIVFSGDIGRYGAPILVDPQPLQFGDLVLIESTYGDRLHDKADPAEELRDIINRTAKRGGIVIVPSFAVGRTQTLLYYLRELKSKRAIPDIPIIVDSPMAGDATEIYRRHPHEYDERARALLEAGKEPFSPQLLYFVKDRYESMKLNKVDSPMILISASGMLTGGRILHHLKRRLPDPRNTVLFVGFQPPGSRGAWLKSGAQTCQMLGEEIRVRAEMAEMSGLSAHADRDELLRWCQSCSGTPGRVAIVHGEPDSAKAFGKTLEERFKWSVSVPQYLSTIQV